MKILYRYLFFLILIGFSSACSVTNTIGEGKHIVAKNKIHISGKEDITKVELEPYIIQPQTHKALAFFYSNLYIYKTFKAKKDNGFNRWIIRVFGAEPIIWDSLSTSKSEKDISAYLNNIGYFNAVVHSSVEKNNSKATISYQVDPGKPYRIEELHWDIADTNMQKENIQEQSLIQKGEIFNTYLLSDERERVSEVLRNSGYYDFNPEYVNFIIDSAFNRNVVHVTAQVLATWTLDNDTILRDFKKYKINNVYIFPDYEKDRNLNQDYDTLVIDLGNINHAKAIGKYHFLYKEKLRTKPSVIGQSVFIEPGEYFNSRDLKETYQKLNRFPIVKYVDIGFRKKTDSAGPMLNTYIRMYRSRLQYFSVETDGTNSSGDLGVRFGFNYGNKNIFKGGELINLRLTTAFENRHFTGYDDQTSFLFFNTLEYGIILSFYSPTFMVPVKQSRFPKYFNPQTFIRFGYNYQLRPSYKRHISSSQFGYEWKQSKYIFHRLTPLDLSITKIFPSANFQAALDTITNQRYKDQYQDHFIASVNYNFIYNTQQLDKNENFTFFNARLEAAGNITYGMHELFNSKKTDGYYTITGIRFAQFFRVEFDYRHYIALTNRQGIIYRINTGVGLPYGNSSALPFERGFYGGGANGMRAWAYRNLGPGVYDNSLGAEYDKMGDIKLEGNLEYRFPLYGYLKGAAFVDAGNIWLLYNSETLPGGEFAWNTFYKQFALDGGIGFRFDFDFFIIRIDGAAKIQDPSKIASERFVLPKTQISDIFWSFGIGYPF